MNWIHALAVVMFVLAGVCGLLDRPRSRLALAVVFIACGLALWLLAGVGDAPVLVIR